MNTLKRTAYIIALFILMAWIITGCSTANPQPDTVVSEDVLTQAAQTIVAQMTLTAPAPTHTLPPPTATFTPEPTSPPTPTETVPPVVPTATPTLSKSLVVSETAAATESPAESPTPELTATSEVQFETVFEDNFSNSIFWDEAEGPDRSDWRMNFGLGGYRIFVGIVNDFVWSVRGDSYEDISAEVDARRVEGPTDGFYGILCRQLSPNNYYGLVVSSDGTYGIFKKKSAVTEWLKQSTEPSPAVAVGESFTRVRADCIGETLSLYANGQKLMEVQDSDFVAGPTGLLAGTRQQSNFTALFDNYVLRAP